MLLGCDRVLKKAPTVQKKIDAETIRLNQTSRCSSISEIFCQSIVLDYMTLEA